MARQQDEFERRIRSIMAEKGITTGDIAEELGTTRQAVYAVVCGETTRTTSRYAVAAAIGVHPSKIWGDEWRG